LWPSQDGGLLDRSATAASINFETVPTIVNHPYDSSYLLAPRRNRKARPAKPDQFSKIILQAYKNVQFIPRDSRLPHHRMLFLSGAIRDDSTPAELT
jgi:hypothetical protein